jgi:type IX secretion system PorP/SprF family membrane protein
MRKLLISLLSSLVFLTIQAQDIGNFTQFFMNPYVLNPSYAGIEGRSAVFLTYRKQWMDVEGAPTIGNFSFHTASKRRMNFGLNFNNDQRSVLNTTSALITLGYELQLGKDQFLRFGISGGGAWNMVDWDQLTEGQQADPAFQNLLDANAYLIGNAGLSLHLKTFHLGVAMPSVVPPAYSAEEIFTINEVAPFEALVVHMSNRFYFANDRHVFEPYLVYRHNNLLPSQYEAAAVMHLNHVVWFGGSYKQDFGISAMGGLKLNKLFAIGGSYTLQNTGINELNSPTIEVQMSLLFGGKKEKRQMYSFANTEKPKEVKKTPQQLLAEKKAEAARQAEEAKKREEEWEAERQAEEQAAAQAAIRRQQERIDAERRAEEERQAQQQTTEQRRQEEARVAEERRREEERQQQEAQRRQEQDRQAEQQRQAEQARQREQQRQEEERKAAEAQKAEEQRKEQERQAELARRREQDRLDAERRAELLRQEQEAARQQNEAERKRLEDLRLAEEKRKQEESIRRAQQETLPQERRTIVAKGRHPKELGAGEHIIAGVFSKEENAQRFIREIRQKGFDGQYGFNSEKGLWYVFIFKSDDVTEARRVRDNYRKIESFKEAWLLSVH